MIQNTCSANSFASIIDHIHHDPIGDLIRENDDIRRISKLHFTSNKSDEKIDVSKKKTSTFMRTLVRIYMSYNEKLKSDHKQIIKIEELFHKANLEILTDIVDDMAAGRPSVILNCFNTIKTAATLLSTLHNIDDKMDQHQYVKNFIDVSDILWKNRRKRAEEALYRVREETSRNPNNLPDDETVAELIANVSEYLDSVVPINDAKTYLKIRQHLSTFLILTNGRRGNECHRLTTEQCKLGLQQEYMDKRQLHSTTSSQKQIVNNNVMFYVRAKKGGTDVGIKMPKLYIPLVEYLCSSTARDICHINAENKFVFAPFSTEKSSSSGWHDFNAVCKAYNVLNINATKIRHIVATQMDDDNLTPEEVDRLCKHMGHTKSIHNGIYKGRTVVKDMLIAEKISNRLRGRSAGAKETLQPHLNFNEISTHTNIDSPPESINTVADDNESMCSQSSQCSSEESFDQSDYEKINNPRIRWIKEEKAMLSTNWRKFIETGNIECSPRPISKNIRPFVKKHNLKSLGTELATPAKVEKVRTTLYNMARTSVLNHFFE